MTLLSAAILLFLVLDPLGNIPLFLSALQKVPKERRRRVIIRESLIALCVLIFFFLFGNQLLKLLHLDGTSLGVAGGVILFLIALRMIFPDRVPASEAERADDPFIVPLAIPLIAGPSAIATVLLFMTNDPHSWLKWFFAIVCAWAASTLILVASPFFNRFLGDKGLAALERLMGMILTTISIQMLLTGIAEFFAKYPARA